MFNVGGMELVAIGLVALVVLGPDRLPGAIRQVGAVVGQLEQVSRGFQTDLSAAMAQAEAEVDAEARSCRTDAGPVAPSSSDDQTSTS